MTATTVDTDASVTLSTDEREEKRTTARIIKGVTVTLPVVGRVMIGHTEMKKIEGEMRGVPVKDSFFTVTTNVQKPDRSWEPHPVAASLSKDGEKVTRIPIVIFYNDINLNLSNGYTAFDSRKGRVLCRGDGCKARRLTPDGVQSIDCPRPESCDFGRENRCKSMTRFFFRIEGQSPDDLGVFALRTTGLNSLTRLASHLGWYSAALKGKLAGLPMTLLVTGKSTQQSMRTPIYHVDLALREGHTCFDAIREAKAYQEAFAQAGISLDDIEASLLAGLANSDFADEIEDADEWESLGSDVDFLAEFTGGHRGRGLRGLDALGKKPEPPVADERSSVVESAAIETAGPTGSG
jgi:hypothetical protein